MKTKEEKKQKAKEYYEKNKEKIKAQAIKWQEKNKIKKKLIQKKYYERTAPERKEYQQEYFAKNYEAKIKEYRIRHREAYDKIMAELHNVYSNGTNKCICGADIDDLHHTDPKDGRHERDIFGNQRSLQVRKYQLMQYATNPDYMVGLCKECHLTTHRDLREAKKK